MTIEEYNYKIAENIREVADKLISNILNISENSTDTAKIRKEIESAANFICATTMAVRYDNRENQFPNPIEINGVFRKSSFALRLPPLPMGHKVTPSDWIMHTIDDTNRAEYMTLAGAVSDFLLKNIDKISFDNNNKTIHFVHVYKKDCPTDKIADNDNTMYGGLINAITDVIGGGDSAFVCSYNVSALRSEYLCPATYIIVYNKNNPLVKEEYLLLQEIKS